MNSYKHPLRVGVGGPVGSGKTALLEALCKRCAMRQLAVVTNDIYTKEDQRILTEAGALAPERIVGGNRRLPAYGDPRRCLNEPRRRGSAE